MERHLTYQTDSELLEEGGPDPRPAPGAAAPGLLMTARDLPRPEYEVLLHSLSQAQDGLTRLSAALSGVVDWDYLFQGALKHGVFPSLYRRLADTCPEAAPPEVLAAWRRLYQ